MPMPWTFRHSEREFKSFLKDARTEMDLQSDNNTYTAIEGVLRCFRLRLEAQQVVDFGQVIPSTLRAIMQQGWHVAMPPVDWGTREAQIAEVKALRPHHNLTPDNAIEATAYALWRHCNHIDLTRELAKIGPQALAFWQVTGHPAKELEQKMI